jgi:PAS domain S-box-containing protein
MNNPEHQNELFRLAIESAPTAMILVDEAGRIVLVNAQTERLFGYPRAELLGQTIDLLVPERFRGTHPGHRRSFFAEPQVRSMGAGRDLFGLRKDGTEVPVEIGLNPFKTSSTSFVLAAIVDITERRRAEERFRAVVESSPSAMLMVDANGKIVLVNAQTEKLFGYTRQEILGQSIETLVPGRFRGSHPGHRADFNDAPRSRPMGVDRELYGLRKDGSEVPVEIGLNPIKTAEGDFVLAAVVDLTVFKRMQAEVIRTQSLAALGEMAATIAHEVKNPLAAISGPLQILERDLQAGNPHKELMGEILAQVKRLDQTVRGLLAFSKPTTPAKQSIPLQEFVERIGRLTGEHRHDIKVVYEGPADALLAADPALLEQVLWNLFLNGMEAIKGGGRIRVLARTTQGVLELSVVDTGSGIPPDLLQKLFKPFVTTKNTGTGLGLSLCRKIVEAHRGTIEISSVPGTGTTVLLRFPSA